MECSTPGWKIVLRRLLDGWFAITLGLIAAAGAIKKSKMRDMDLTSTHMTISITPSSTNFLQSTEMISLN